MAVRSSARFEALRVEPGNPVFPTLPDGVQVPHVALFGGGGVHQFENHPLTRGRVRSTGPDGDAQRWAGWQDLTTWINPAIIDFGTIPVPVQRTVSLYNARPTQITVTAISLPAGVSLVSPALPVVLGPYSGVSFVLEAQVEGDSTLDDIVSFSITGGDDVAASAIGSRIFTLEVFPQRPIVETVRFKTSILRSKDATEKPYGLLRSPSSIVDYNVRFTSDTRRQTFRNRIMSGRSSLTVGAQKWYEARKTTAAATSTDTVIQVPTAYGSFEVDRPVSIVTPSGVEVLATVSSFDASSITFTNAIGVDIPAGSQVMPVGLGYLSRFPRFSTYPVNAEDHSYQVVFNRQPDVAALPGSFPVFDTLPVLEVCNEIRGRRRGQRGAHNRTEEVLDSKLSNRIAFSTFPYGEDEQQFDVSLFGAAEIWKWRQFLAYLDGSYGELWVPTFREDVTGVSIATPDVTFDADFTGLSLFEGDAPREALRLEYPDGTIEYRQILTVVDNGATESITVATPNLPAGDPKVSILQRARIVGDNAVFTFERPEFARLRFRYRTIQT